MSRWVLSVFSIIAYGLIKISVNIYAGGVVVLALLGIDFWTGTIVLGGINYVVYKETLQANILVL